MKRFISGIIFACACFALYACCGDNAVAKSKDKSITTNRKIDNHIYEKSFVDLHGRNCTLIEYHGNNVTLDCQDKLEY